MRSPGYVAGPGPKSVRSSGEPALTGSQPVAPLVHDYFVQDGGAEAVALELASDCFRMLPFTRPTSSVLASGAGSIPVESAVGPPARAAAIALVPAPAAGLHRQLQPAGDSGLAARPEQLLHVRRAVRARRPAVHVAYVHTPLRFAWDVDNYLTRSSFPRVARAGLRVGSSLLRRWDRWAGRRPDVLVANSLNVQRRIRSAWGRDSSVIYPPVNVADTRLSTTDDGFYLVATRLLAYKRVDLAVQACARLGRDLIVVGDGPERGRLEPLAGPRTRFEGHVDRRRLEELVESCHALITPGIEDFGIMTVEAMAVGKPVVAFGAGGTLETVIDGRTGILFEFSLGGRFGCRD